MRGQGGVAILGHVMLIVSFALSKLWICVQHNQLPCLEQETESYKFPTILPQPAVVLRETLESINISKDSPFVSSARFPQSQSLV